MAAGAKHLHNNKIWQWQQVFHILRKTCGKFFTIESGKFEKTFFIIKNSRAKRNYFFVQQAGEGGMGRKALVQNKSFVSALTSFLASPAKLAKIVSPAHQVFYCETIKNKKRKGKICGWQKK